MSGSLQDKFGSDYLTHHKVFNFEVADLHTYVADGLRVHNTSGFLGRVGNALDYALDYILNFERDSTGDQFTDWLTQPFHIAGNAIHDLGQFLEALVDPITQYNADFFNTNDFESIGTSPSGQKIYSINGFSVLDVGGDGDARNDVYVFTDAQGNVTYSDTRPFGATGGTRTPAQDLQGQKNWENLKEFLGIEDSTGGTSTGGGDGGGGGGFWDSVSDFVSDIADVVADPFGDNDGDGTINLVDFDDGIGPLDTNKDTIEPVILDLDSDGIEVTTGADVFFDIDGDGFKENTSWVSAHDGFLVIDLPEDFNTDSFNGDWSSITGDNEIDQAHELAFALWGPEGATDLEGLAHAFNSNDADDVLNSADAVWSHLRIFQDLDQDGEVDTGELKTLAEWGITEVGLTYDDKSDYSVKSDDITVFGNTLHGLASYKHDGTKITTKDAEGNDIAIGADDENGIFTVEGGVGDMSLSANELGYKKVKTDFGYTIEFEGGATLRYGDLSTASSGIMDLAELNLDGAFGDDDPNQIRGFGSIANLQISGGGGNDLVQGGWGDDWLSGDAGADNIQGGGGDDVIFFDAEDTFIDGGAGIDVAIVVDDGSDTAPGITLDLQATNFESAFGGSGDDDFRVNASFGADIQMSGGAGNDTLNSGAGNDGLDGGDGDDILRANQGDDVVSGGDGLDQIDGGTGDDLLLGGAGNDTIAAGSGDDQLFGDNGNDRLVGWSGDDFIVGGQGNDTLVGHVDDDQLFGGDGNDILDGGDGDDFLDGGDGNDRIIAGSGDDRVDGGLGNDTVTIGTNGDNWIQGGEGDDVFIASNYAGSNVVLGGIGSDTLILDGTQADFNITNASYNGLGVAQFEIVGAPGNLNVNLHVQDIEVIQFSDGTAITLSGTDATADNFGTYYDFDAYWRADQAHNLTSFQGAYGSFDELISGWVGNSAYTGNFHTGHDFVWASDETDTTVADVISGNGNDTVISAAGDDTLVGGSGDDALATNAGEDSVDAGSGSDLVQTGTEDDTVYAGSGADWVQTGDQQDVITGGSGADTLLGGNGFDSIRGGSGSDVISGGAQKDFLYGEDGSDILWGGHGDDEMFGGGGADLMDGGDGQDSMSGGNGSDTLDGGAGNDTLLGNFVNHCYECHSAQADIIDGGDGYDVMDGGVGNDQLDGGGNDDTLRGGEGDDVLLGGAGNDSLDGGEGSDYLEGGAGADIINGGGFPTDVAGYATSDAGVHVDLNVGTAAGGHATGDTLISVEALIGSTWNDTLAGDANANLLAGGVGDDLLIGLDGQDRLNGGFGADTLLGGNGQDVLVGDDEIGSWWGALFVEYADSQDERVGFIRSFEDLNLTEHTGPEPLAVLHGFTDAMPDFGAFGVPSNLNAKVYINGSQVFPNNDSGSLDHFLFPNTPGSYEITIEVFTAGSGGYTVPKTGNDIGLFSQDMLGSPIELEAVRSNFDDRLVGGAGSDYLLGGVGEDSLYGEADSDPLAGGEGDDLLDASWGFDVLDGGAGDDQLTGGGNWDIFVFSDAGGNDTITDFDVANGFERIDLTTLTGISSFSDLDANHLTQSGSDALINDGDGTTIRLIGVNADDLTAGDFIF